MPYHSYAMLVQAVSGLILVSGTGWHLLQLQAAWTVDVRTVLLLCTYLIGLVCVGLAGDDVVSIYSVMSFVGCSVVLLQCNSVVVLVLAYEMLNLPLAVLLVHRNAGAHRGVAYSSKGVLLSLLLLLVYGTVSGVLLWIGAAYYLSTGVSTVGSLGGVHHTSAVILWIIAAAVKVALVPVHVWLGKVHVESSTVGSVLLAGIALKAGWYVHTLVAAQSVGALGGLGVYSLAVTSVLLVGGVYTSVVLMRQLDTKRWVAMYSVTHMQTFYGVWMANGLGVGTTGVLTVGMLAHSLLASALFVLVGNLAEVYGTRQWSDLPVGAVRTSPLLVAVLLNGSVPSSPILLVELTTVGVCTETSVVLAYSYSASVRRV